jgi:hypothetical protein
VPLFTLKMDHEPIDKPRFFVEMLHGALFLGIISLLSSSPMG